jgi:hypothetical protein
MSKLSSIEKDVILHRLTVNRTTWDEVIGETELAIQQLKNTLSYLKKQKSEGAPFPLSEQNASTHN